MNIQPVARGTMTRLAGDGSNWFSFSVNILHREVAGDAEIVSFDGGQAKLGRNLVCARIAGQRFERAEVWCLFPLRDFVGVTTNTRFGRQHFGWITPQILRDQ
jgi:hypothetical protein